MEREWKAGDIIKCRWEVRQVLMGGMGVVYLAYDREWHEAVAIKTFQDHVLQRGPTIAQRFVQESLAWIKLELHQNIVEARFVQNLEGRPLLFLEYVSGGDLSRWIGSPRLMEDFPLVLRLGIGFCDGMEHARSKGLAVHRDIKPQNCLLTADSVLKITDFGLAKLTDSNANFEQGPGGNPGSEMGASKTGAAVGTFTHMSPEQFSSSKHVDTRADIYSFGVMLFQMAVGELPFIGRSFEEFALLHMRETAPIDKIRNRRLRSVVEKCLSKTPDQRYARFADLRGDLASLYEAETGESAAQPVTGDKLTAFHLVNKGASLSILKKPEEALGWFDRAILLDPSLAEAWQNKGSILTDKGQTAEALRCYNRALSLKPRLQDTWTNKGQLLLRLGQLDDALACFNSALSLSARNVNAWFGKGTVLAELERHEEAVGCYENALAVDTANEKAWFNMARSLGLLARHEGTLKCCDHALAINPHDPQTWSMKGMAFGCLKRYEEALSCFRQAQNLGDEKAASSIDKCLRLLSR